jgi:hypothetical protein
MVKTEERVKNTGDRTDEILSVGTPGTERGGPSKLLSIRMIYFTAFPSPSNSFTSP